MLGLYDEDESNQIRCKECGAIAGYTDCGCTITCPTCGAVRSSRMGSLWNETGYTVEQCTLAQQGGE